MSNDEETAQAKTYPEVRFLPLTPDYKEGDHGIYLECLEEALKKPRIRNIALSGDFGIGKSSILEEFRKRHSKRVSMISVANILTAPQEETNDKSAASLPKEESRGLDQNSIQEEILNQLLSSAAPHKMPESNFKRITKYRLWPKIVISAFLALFLSPILFFTVGRGTLERWQNFVDLISLLFIFIAITVFLSFTAWGLRSVLPLKNVSIKSTGVGTEIQATDNSCFNAHLEEIIYFFEVSGHDIVIFEDIDRYNNPQIFDSLRMLNTLLNNSQRIKKRILFIYAVRDSAFSGPEEKAEEPSWETSNNKRVKFFDLIIPIVPFISRHNAIDVFRDHLFKDRKVNWEDKKWEDLIKLLAEHIHDMRLFKNIVNEFLVFRRFSPNKKDDFKETSLFAMMVYKNIDPKAFEEIRVGKGTLNKLYRISKEKNRDWGYLYKNDSEFKDEANNLKELFRELIKQRYIDEYFPSYSAVSHSNLTINANTFLIQHVYANDMKADYALNEDEIEELLKVGKRHEP